MTVESPPGTTLNEQPAFRPTVITLGPADITFEACPRRAKVQSAAVVGLGYVGLPTALALATRGVEVLGIDTSRDRLASVRNGRVDLLDTDLSRLQALQGSNLLNFTGDPEGLSTAQVVLICVPTPVDEYFTPDLRALRAACDEVVARAVPGQIIVLTSTTYVGSTHDLIVKPLSKRGLKAGRDVYVAFSPERIDPGNRRHIQERTPRVVGGVTEVCTSKAQAILKLVAADIHCVGSPEAAEMAKLLENTFRAVNIALINEMADACRHMSLDIVEVINAAATKPYGFMPFFPGPGVGGHCIPCDPHYLLWQLRKDRSSSPVIEAAMKGIAARPRRVVDRAQQVLSAAGRSFVGARVLMVGVAYKPGVADIRESPALDIMRLLQQEGALVGYTDNLVPALRTHDGEILVSTQVTASHNYDLVVLHTLHPGQELEWLSNTTPVLDTTYRASAFPQRITL